MKYLSKLLCLALALQIGCSDDDSEDSGNTSGGGGHGSTPPSGPFLETSELAKPSDLTELSADDVREFLADYASDFLATEDGTAPQAENGNVSLVAALTQDDDDYDYDYDEFEFDDSCFKEQIEQSAVSGSGEKLIVSIGFDTSACPAPEGVEGMIFGLRFAMYMELTCEGANFSSLNGKRLDELEEMDNVCDSSGTIVSNNFFEMTIGMEMEGFSLTSTAKSRGSQSTATGQACAITKQNDTYEFTNACVFIDIAEELLSMTSEGETETANQNTYFKYTMGPGVSWVDSEEDSWYSAGTVPVELNNWTGTITFEGATEIPNYEMTNGSQTIDGTLVSTGFSLHSVKSVDRISQLKQSAIQSMAKKRAEFQK